ncbi:DJ-1/PfpI family protein [Fictibacillus sp. JL2B1089]|uniref:DJ-1/PfpI family protein n=1 Tax=Fictibacillus sp. JL2B1089 TaxID=3399565 RepID=UPI003A884BDC
MKKVLLLVYDSFADFEVAILNTCLSGSEYELVTCSPDSSIHTVTSAGNLKIKPDLSVNEITIDDYSALIIPGGTPFPFLENSMVTKMIRSFFDKDKLIGAICGGPALLGAAGILNHIQYTASLTEDDSRYTSVMNWGNKCEEHLVIDQNVITATGSNYIQFAEEVLRQLKVFPNNTLNPLEYFKVPTMS